MREYETYKDSGVDWIPEIPSHWDVRRTDNLFCHNKERNTKEEEHVVLSLSYGNVVRRDIETNFGLLPESFDTYQVLNLGDIVLRLTDLQNDKRSLRVGLSKHRGIITSAYVGLRAKHSTVYSPFFYRLFYTYDILKLFYTLGAGVRQSMRFEDVRRIPLLIPPLPEQQQIVSFLDERTSLIDKIIENKTQRIELLKEMRSSLISEVVTKGLNPEVPMKDSEVEWIGEIPSHWNRIRLKYSTDGSERSFTDGDWIESPVIVDDGIRYLTTGNVGEGVYKEQGHGHISETTFHELNCTEVFPGDILISRLNLPIGRSCIVPDLEKRIITSVDNVVCRPTDHFSRRFIVYCLTNPKFFQFTETISRGTTMSRISGTMLGNLPLLVPPLKEQEEIVSFLNEKTSLTDQEIGREENSIEYLKEVRRSLIHEVVTGKMDVRVGPSS